MQPVQNYTYDVFLCHATADQDAVTRLAGKLKESGLRVWLAEWTVAAGELISPSIAEGLASARKVVVCLSKAAVRSPWVRLEYSTAQVSGPANPTRRIIPVLLEECDVPEALAAYHRLDYRQESPAVLGQLLRACAPSLPESTSALGTGSGGQCALLNDMAEAFLDMRGRGLTELSVLSYVGNITVSMLRAWKEEDLRGLKLRLLVRSPGEPWTHPPAGSAQRQKRMEQIKANLSDVEENPGLRGLFHRDPKFTGVPCYAFLPSDPCVRAVLAESVDGRRLLYLGFYPPQERGPEGDIVQRIWDFSGTRSPVLRIEADDAVAGRLVSHFAEWFDFVWQLQTEREKIQAAMVNTRSPDLPVAVDFDGVIADTDTMKVEWFNRCLGRVIPADGCSRSRCVPRFCSLKEYEEMSAEVYARATTRRTPEVADAVATIRRLAEQRLVFVITARNAENVRWAEEWLGDHGLVRSVAAVLSSGQAGGRIRKLDSAARCHAVALIDDDERHLLASDHANIRRLLFTPAALPRPTPPLNPVASWLEVERVLSQLPTTSRSGPVAASP